MKEFGETLLVIDDITKMKTYFPKKDGTANKSFLYQMNWSGKYKPRPVHVYKLVAVITDHDEDTNWEDLVAL